MSISITIDSRKVSRSFVAYNLVFGPSSNGLAVITAEGLSDVMSQYGYDMPVDEAKELLDEWVDAGKLRHRIGEGGRAILVIA